VTKNVFTTAGQAYIISVENYFSGPNTIVLNINGVQAYNDSVSEDSAANMCIIGDGSTVVLTANDSTGGNFSIRVFRIRRSRVEIWQGSEVTLRYDGAKNAWVETSDADPEHCSILGQKSVLFKGGDAWIHDDLQNGGILFGVPHECGLVVVTNQYPGDVKEPMTVSVDSTVPPSYMHFRTEKPYIQSTDLIEDEFTTLEGMHYADVRYDRLTPGMEPEIGARLGDSLRGNDIIATAAWENVAENADGGYVGSLDINYKISKGHK
jgi:hypothetical protein